MSTEEKVRQDPSEPQDSQQLTMRPERRPNLKQPQSVEEVNRDMGCVRRLTEQPYGT